MQQASASASPSQEVQGASPSTSSATNAAPQGDKVSKQEADNKKGKVASVGKGSNTPINSGARRLLSTPDNDDANAITVAPDENTAVSPRALHSEGPDNDDCIITGQPCHGLGDNVGDVIFNEEGAKGVVDDTPFTVAFEQPIASSSQQHGVTGACARTPTNPQLGSALFFCMPWGLVMQGDAGVCVPWHVSHSFRSLSALAAVSHP